MKRLYKHNITASFLLWLDHEILKEGEAFTNTSSDFFPVNNNYQGIFTYGLPYKQTVSDTSIANADILSGVTVNGTFTIPGSGDLIDVNYEHGLAFFSSDQAGNTLNGEYAVKEINVSNAEDKAEEDLLFETKFELRPEISQNPTGLAPNDLTVPHIFIKNAGSSNKEWAFGGKEQTTTNIRAIVLADSAFMIDAVESICVDTRGKHICLLEPEDMPLNPYGGWLSGVAYNYDGVVASKANSENVYVEEVFVSKLSSLGEDLKEVNPHVVAAFIDFEITHERTPRV
tara:strand:+ start:120586 stop:121443 length:858 start_codon:yes stop_codon:yes gene_type:complete